MRERVGRLPEPTAVFCGALVPRGSWTPLGTEWKRPEPDFRAMVELQKNSREGGVRELGKESARGQCSTGPEMLANQQEETTGF